MRLHLKEILKIFWVTNVTNYINIKLRISEGQKDKLKKAFESNCESITIRLTFSDMHGEDVIAITKSQLYRLLKAYEAKKSMTIKISKTRFVYNMKIEGRFLPLLTGTVLPVLGVEALSGLASTVFRS